MGCRVAYLVGVVTSHSSTDAFTRSPLAASVMLSGLKATVDQGRQQSSHSGNGASSLVDLAENCSSGPGSRSKTVRKPSCSSRLTNRAPSEATATIHRLLNPFIDSVTTWAV